MARCAVVDCERKGKPHVCPHDGTRHGHGCVHYNCGHPRHSLEFHSGTWDWLCDQHYKIVRREREEFERRDR